MIYFAAARHRVLDALVAVLDLGAVFRSDGGRRARVQLWCAAALQSDGGRRARVRLWCAAALQSEGCRRARVRLWCSAALQWYGVSMPGCVRGAPRHCSRRGVGVPGCVCGAPRRGRRGRSGDRVCPLRVRGCRVAGLPRGQAAAWTWPSLPSSPWPPRSRRNLKRARPSMHPKASLLSALGITRRPCGVPPLLPANPFTIELEIERSRLAGPGCPGRPASRPWGGDPVHVHAE